MKFSRIAPDINFTNSCRRLCPAGFLTSASVVERFHHIASSSSLGMLLLLLLQLSMATTTPPWPRNLVTLASGSTERHHAVEEVSGELCELVHVPAI